MNTKYFVIIAVILIMAVVLAAVYVGFRNNSNHVPINTPIPLLDGNVSSLGEEDMNVTQGSALQVNVTLTSRADQELTIPIENLTLSGFNNTRWDTSIPQNKVFNYTFSTNQLVLQPHGSNSTVLTINVAEDASLGQYVFTIELGNWQVTHFGGISVIVRVTPKLE